MRTTKSVMMRGGVCSVAFLLYTIGAVRAEDSKPYPARAPMEQYRAASVSEEIALARSAAPASISDDASILTLGANGYETAVQGKNGFVCVVERSWGAGFDEPEFWNPRIRGPICFNAAAARSVLPIYLERTKWVIAGAPKAEIVARHKAEVAAKRIATPEPGAMCFMMSKQGYLGDQAGHWHSHLMFFVAKADGASWGADLRGSPIFASQPAEDTFTTFMVQIPTWSDATPAVAETR
jgi:hypothetical protein